MKGLKDGADAPADPAADEAAEALSGLKTAEADK